MNKQPDIEDAIAAKIVEDAIAQGYYVTVEDDEPGQGQIVAGKSKDKDLIVGALRTTSADTLYFHNRNQKPCGWVLLMWGNGTDLISNCSANDDVERILEGAYALADNHDEAH